jgi:hypothetical protein
LDVACRPVVEEREAEEVLLCLGDRNAAPERVAGANVSCDFQFIVELGGGLEDGGGLTGEFDLAVGTADGSAADDQRRRAPMVANRNPRIIWEKRLVRTEELTNVGGVVDRGVEVGVVFRSDRLEEEGARGRDHQRGDEALLIGVTVAAGLDGLEEVDEALAESRPGGGAAAHEGVKLRGGTGELDVGWEIGEEFGFAELTEIEYEGADADAEVGRGVGR